MHEINILRSGQPFVAHLPGRITFGLATASIDRLGVLKKESLNTMCVDHILAWRPSEDSELTILRGNQRHGFVLVEYELRCRKMSRASELSWLDHDRTGTFDRLRHDHISDLWRSLAAHYFGTKREHLKAIGHYSSAVHRSEPSYSLNGVQERIYPPTVCALGIAVFQNLRQRRKRWDQDVVWSRNTKHGWCGVLWTLGMRDNKWLRLLAYVTGLVNQELLLQNEYLTAENRILRAHLPPRLRLSNPERSTLAEIGKRLGPRALAEVARVAKPATILAWYRRLIASKFDGSKHRRYPGRPRIGPGSWGADR
jgi:hypothetical protein